jgi:hypothetical protein
MEIKTGERFKDYVGCKFWVSHSTDEGLVLIWEDGIMEIWDKNLFIKNLAINRFFRDRSKRWEDLFEIFCKGEVGTSTAEDFYNWISKNYKVPESI